MKKGEKLQVAFLIIALISLVVELKREQEKPKGNQSVAVCEQSTPNSPERRTDDLKRRETIVFKQR